MKIRLAMRLHADDTVATMIEAGEVGDAVDIGPERIQLITPVPFGHKVAIRAMRRGDPVIKYGEPIGEAVEDIAVGCHTHVHNVRSRRGRGDLV